MHCSYAQCSGKAEFVLQTHGYEAKQRLCTSHLLTVVARWTAGKDQSFPGLDIITLTEEK